MVKFVCAFLAVSAVATATPIPPPCREADGIVRSVTLEQEPASRVATLQRAIDLCPAMVEAHYLLGRAHADGGNLIAAEDAFQAALQRRADNRTSIALGIVAARRGERARAEALFREVLAREPGSLAAAQGLLTVVEEGGDREKILAELQRLRGALEESPEGLLLVGLVLERQGDSAGARAAYRAALARSPSDVVRVQLFSSLSRVGEVAAAIEAAAPLGPTPAIDRERARLLLSEGNVDQAEAILQRVVAEDLSDAESVVLYVTVLLQRDRAERALSVLGRFREDEVLRHPRLLGLRGVARVALGETDGGIADLTKAVALDPTAADLQEQLRLARELAS